MSQQTNVERVVNEAPDFPPPGTEPRKTDLSHLTLCMLGHAHIDLGYRWDYRETVHRIAPWTFRGVLDLMDRVDGLTFCQSQAYLYLAMQKHYPDLFGRIRRRIREGRWEFVGANWAEYDAMLTGGESIIRQHLQGVRYAEDTLGLREHRVAFFPDSFAGHAATLPQILSGCGLRYYLFTRGLPRNPARPEETRRAFRWRARDGSCLTAFLPFGPYSTPPLTEEQLQTLWPYARASVDPRELVLYGLGDHGGGPRDEDVDALRNLANLEGAPAWRFDTAHAYFHDVLKAQNDAIADYEGNLSGTAPGALTSQARIKRENRRIERLLLHTEAFAVVGTILQRKPAYPRVDFQDCWREYLVHQFHDVLPGTSAPIVYRQVHASYRRVRERIHSLRGDALKRIASRVDTRGPGRSLLVFNPAFSPATHIIEADLPAPLASASHHGIRVQTGTGERVDSDLQGKKLRLAARLPPLGYKQFHVLETDEKTESPRPPSLEAGVLETAGWSARFDPDTGDLLSAVRRGDGREILGGAGNVLAVFDEHELATSWATVLPGTRREILPEGDVRVAEWNPFCTRVEARSRTASSSFLREVTLYRDLPRIDFRLVVDWNEADAFLKVLFRPLLTSPEVVAALPHGAATVRTPAEEFCTHEYVLLRDAHHALALFNDGSYAARFRDGVLELSVMRNVRDMDPGMDHGRHELRYSLFPCPPDTSEAALFRWHGEFADSPICLWEPPHRGEIPTWGGNELHPALSGSSGLVKVSPSNMLLCAFKMPEEDWTPQAFVVRVREASGRAGPCTVTLPCEARSAVRSDHLERPSEQQLQTAGRNVSIDLEPFEIATILIYI